MRSWRVNKRPVERLAKDALLLEDDRRQTERCKKPHREHGGMGDRNRSRQAATLAITREEQIDPEWHRCDRRRLFEQKSCAQERASGEEFGPHSRPAPPEP